MHTEYILFFCKLSLLHKYLLSPAKCPSLLHAGAFFHSHISEEPRSNRLLTCLPLDSHQDQHHSQTLMLPHGDLFVRKWSHFPSWGSWRIILVEKSRKVDSWLEENLLYFLILFFPKRTQICCSLKQFHHLKDHLLAQPFLPFSFSFSSSPFLCPLVSSFIYPFLSAFHCLLSLLPLCTIIYFLFINLKYLES